MKTGILLTITIVLITTETSFGQTDSIPDTTPLYWTFEFGSSYLTHIDSVNNKSPSAFSSLSVAWYFFLSIPLSKQDSLLHGFSIAPGIGFGENTFSIDKAVSVTDGTIHFIPITQNYNYSTISGTYLDIPIDLRYITIPDLKRRNFSFELGGKLGFLVLTSRTMNFDSGGTSTTITETHFDGLEKIRYGISGKISYRKMRVSKDKESYYGYACSLIGNYYPSDFMKDINSKYYSVGIGFSFIYK